MRIVFCHNRKTGDSLEQAEFDTPATVARITRALESGGHEVIPLEVSGPLSAIALRLESLAQDLVFNTAEGRVKTKNLHANPAVALSVTNEGNPYENLIIQGKVVEMTAEGADADIDALAKRYLDADSYPFRQPGEERVIVKIEPEKVNHANP